MTHSPDPFVKYETPTLVYIRPFLGKELLAENLNLRMEIEPDQVVYGVHTPDGVRLAVLTDSESAFAAAIAHDYTPVSVH